MCSPTRARWNFTTYMYVQVTTLGLRIFRRYFLRIVLFTPAQWLMLTHTPIGISVRYGHFHAYLVDSTGLLNIHAGFDDVCGIEGCTKHFHQCSLFAAKPREGETSGSKQSIFTVYAGSHRYDRYINTCQVAKAQIFGIQQVFNVVTVIALASWVYCLPRYVTVYCLPRYVTAGRVLCD